MDESSKCESDESVYNYPRPINYPYHYPYNPYPYNPYPYNPYPYNPYPYNPYYPYSYLRRRRF